MRIPRWVVALAAFAVLVTPSVALAQGADSPTAAVEAFARALQKKDTDLLTQVGPPDSNGLHQILLTALTVHDVEVTGEYSWDDEVIVTVNWKAEFHYDAFLEGVAEGARERGIDEEQIKKQIAEARANAEFEQQMRSAFEASSMDVLVEEDDDGRFRVSRFDPTPDRGDQDRERLIERFVAAWSEHDGDTLQTLLAEPEPASMSGPPQWASIAPLLLATTPSEAEVVDADWTTDTVILRARIAIDEEKLVALTIENWRRYLAEEEGLSPEEIDAAIEEEREQFLTEDLPELLEKSVLPWRELVLSRRGSRWMIYRIRPVDLRAPLREQVLNVMRCAMDAMTARNLDRAVALTPPAERAQMMEGMRLVLAAVTLHDYDLGDIEIEGEGDSGDTATLTMSLSLDYDVEAHMAVAEELYRETLRDAGQPDEEFAAAWDAAKAGFRQEAEQMKELMESANTADLVCIDGCWYISRFRVAE